jgi:hypothetical protein
LIALVIPLRPTREDEASGLDVSEHGEEAYLLTGGMTTVPDRAMAGGGMAHAQSEGVRS